MFNPEQLLISKKNRQRGSWQVVFVIWLMTLAVIACGGAGGALGEQDLDPENSSIGSLPQFIAPSSTFVPTHTARATDTQSDIWIPPSGWHPAHSVCVSGYTQASGYFVCTSWATTPGYYDSPGHFVPGASSTPPATFTPYPTPTPCVSSFTYYFGDEVFTDPAPDTLTLGLSLGNVRTFNTSHSLQQIVAWTVEVRNLGQLNYVLFAPFQIYVSGINGQVTRAGVSEDAASELGLELDEPARDGYAILPSQSLTFDMFAYTAVGDVTSLAFILDPYANGFDGSIAGGNVAYWEQGDRGGCGGRISGDFTPQANLTPQPTATQTVTPSYCVHHPDDCARVIQ